MATSRPSRQTGPRGRRKSVGPRAAKTVDRGDRATGAPTAPGSKEAESVGERRSFQDQLGHRFQDESLLRLALTHPSLVHETGGNTQNNQRLEFLGDAVLQLAITTELYQRFPSVPEGPLTKARAQLVNRTTLAEQGRRLGIGEQLAMSRGEERTGGRSRLSSLADAFEAVVGALFLDGGYDAARAFVLRQFREGFGELDAIPNLDNPKGELQEVLQATSNEPPQYRLESSSGPDHDRSFVCCVYHRGARLAQGEGRSKKEAESEAARAALLRLRAPPELTPPD